MIPQRDLSLIANDLFKEHGGRRVPETVIERDYVLAWFLTGLAHHPLKEALAFKGGTALRRCWYADYRFSEDLDFTLLRDDMTREAILASFDEIFAWVEKESGIRLWYQKEDRHGHQQHRWKADIDVTSFTVRERTCHMDERAEPCTLHEGPARRRAPGGKGCGRFL